MLGLIETVKINGKNVKAKIDTGADRSSICRSLINLLSLTPTGKKRSIRSSTGKEDREVYLAELIIQGKKFTVEFTAAKREHMNYKVLIGKDILKNGFLIDPKK